MSHDTYNACIHDLDIHIGFLPVFRLVFEPFQFTLDGVLVESSPTY
jgi:hypothetical protein